MKYFKIYNSKTPERYTIWARDGIMEKLVYEYPNATPLEDEFLNWHDPKVVGVISIPEILEEIKNDEIESTQTVIENLTKDEVFLEMV